MLNDIYNPAKVVVDVRSPSEYRRGHIPNAVNIPLFSDDERSAVGTAYVQQGRKEAIKLGLDFVMPKVTSLVEHASQVLEDKSPLPVVVYCWRGGMRSAAISWLLRKEGIVANTIEKGYKAYRQKVLSDLGKHCRIVVISGKTGSGKTRVLEELKTRGYAVVNLEQLANHRGSAFGSVGMPAQPSSEHAMNLVHKEFMQYENNQVVFIEDESQSIGAVSIDNGLFERIRTAPRIVLDIPAEIRVQQLCEEYGSADMAQLTQCFNKIHRRLGGVRHTVAVSELTKGNLEGAARVALEYYDATYDYVLTRYASTIISRISSSDGNISEVTDRVISSMQSSFSRKSFHVHGC